MTTTEQEIWAVELRDGRFHATTVRAHAERNFSRLRYEEEMIRWYGDTGEVAGELSPGVLVFLSPLREKSAQEIADCLNKSMPEGVPSFAWTPADFQRAGKALLQELHRQADEISAESKLWCAQFASKTCASPVPHP